ncbi:MAG: AAA family ATPase [Thermoleophilia bacterium]|nr:AAA family ATPase [Thermoleophilia bacterium]
MSGNTPDREMTRLYVTGACEGLPELLEALGRHPELEVVGWSERVVDGAGPLTGGHLDVVVHATGSSELPAEELATIREYTAAPLVVVAAGEASRLLEEALAADVADVLLLPQLTENVVFALRKAGRSGRHMQRTTGTAGRVITVFSPKGGTGKTVTATNLAACFAKFGRKRTLLLDLDLQFGDAAIMLSIEPEKTIHDLVVAPGELDPEKLAGYTTRHASGIDVLPAPVRPEDAELVTESKLSRLLEVARESYDVIVVDTSPFFHGPMLATLDRTDTLVLVCGLEVPTIKNVRLSLQTLELLSFPTNRLKVLLNRANSNVGLKRTEVEAALEVKIAFEVPSDRAVPVAVNRGIPAVVNDSQSDFARAMRGVADSLLPADANAARRRWLPSLARS